MLRSYPRLAVALALAGSLGLPSFAAQASTTTTTVASTTTTTAPPVTWTSFRLEWRTYVGDLKAINTHYRAAVDSALNIYISTLDSAKTPLQVARARTIFNAALSAALNAHVNDILSGPASPVPPPGYTTTVWVTSIQTANTIFRTTLARALATYTTALNAATTSVARTAARTTYRDAVLAAAAAHLNILRDLGLPPKHPKHPKPV